MSLNVLLEFSGAICWRPYIIQVIKAYGIPMNVHTVVMILGLTSIAGGICFLLCVKLMGKRRLYLSSTAIVVLCCFGLGEMQMCHSDSSAYFQCFNFCFGISLSTGIYGIVLFPPNWTSFENSSDSHIQIIQNIAGDYGYLAFALMFVLNFFTSVGLNAVPPIVHAEVFSFKYTSALFNNFKNAFFTIVTWSFNVFSAIFQATFISMRSLIGTPVFYCGHFHKTVLQYWNLVNTFRCNSVLWMHQFDGVCRLIPYLVQKMSIKRFERLFNIYFLDW